MQENQNTTSSNLVTYLKYAGGIVGAGIAIYGLNVLLPYMVMESAKAGAMAGINSTLAYIPGAGHIVNGAVVNQIGTVAAGKAYATVEVTTGLGANMYTTVMAAGAGGTVGSKAVEYTIEGSKTICGALKSAWNYLPSWRSRENGETQLATPLIEI